jgi:hypothetical protein
MKSFEALTVIIFNDIIGTYPPFGQRESANINVEKLEFKTVYGLKDASKAPKIIMFLLVSLYVFRGLELSAFSQRSDNQRRCYTMSRLDRSLIDFD